MSIILPSTWIEPKEKQHFLIHLKLSTHWNRYYILVTNRSCCCFEHTFYKPSLQLSIICMSLMSPAPLCGTSAGNGRVHVGCEL